MSKKIERIKVEDIPTFVYRGKTYQKVEGLVKMMFTKINELVDAHNELVNKLKEKANAKTD